MSPGWEYISATGLEHLWQRTASSIDVPLQPELGLLQTPASVYPPRPHPGMFPRSTPALPDTCMENGTMLPAPLALSMCCFPCAVDPAAPANDNLPRGFYYCQIVLQTEASLVKETEKKPVLGLEPQEMQALRY